MYHSFIKRALDITIALLLLILLSPFFLIITISLFIVNRGSPFFLQPRPGRHARVFKIIKFKSMNDKRDQMGELLSNKDRLTKIGKIIRKTSLDEIPQLFNVIKGDMSLVGPRPLKIDYLKLYNSEQKLRHDVKPGITGWAQVNGRNALTHTEKFKYDVWYVHNYNFILDIKILLLTLLKVLKKDGVSQSGENSNTPFNGFN